jgi:glycine/serine hydroxymethyltransferase
MQQVADLIDETLMHRSDEAQLEVIKEKVKTFSLRFPVPGIAS